MSSRPIWLASLLTGCAGAQISGGHVEDPDGPASTAGRAIDVVSCVDGRGRPVAVMSRLRLQRHMGTTRIVELVAGYDALVVTRFRDQGEHRVFSLLLESPGGDAQLRQYTVPRAATQDPTHAEAFLGTLVVATEWTQSFSLAGLWRAPRVVARRCALRAGPGGAARAPGATARRGHSSTTN